VIAGAAAFRGAPLHPETESGALLLKWIEEGHFQWLYSAEILGEYKELLRRFGVRPSVIGKFINLLREEGIASMLARNVGPKTKRAYVRAGSHSLVYHAVQGRSSSLPTGLAGKLLRAVCCDC
jgi:hypothetical protein